LGRTIIVHPDAVLTPRLLRHELMHVRQWQRDRLGFPFRYAWYHLRYGYGGNPYEIEARRAEQDERPRTRSRRSPSHGLGSGHAAEYRYTTTRHNMSISFIPVER